MKVLNEAALTRFWKKIQEKLVLKADKGVAGGVATLGADGKVPESQMGGGGGVPTTRKINNKALSSDITLTAEDVGARPNTWTPSASDVGAVPTTRKVNNKALSSDITLTASDVGARANTWTPSAADVGAVPTTRKVNNKALSSDITLTASDVGARPSTWTPSAADVGALPITGGTLTGYTKVSSMPVGTNCLRNTKLVSADTNPTTNGEINWTYG